MKLYGLLIFLMLGVCCGSADEIECNFEYDNGGYLCEVLSITPTADDKNTFTGAHLDGKNNDDVIFFLSSKGSDFNLTNFDSSFCQEFKNLEQIFTINMAAGSVKEDALVECQNLNLLYLYKAYVPTIPDDFFPEHLKLKTITFDHSQLEKLPSSLRNQDQLRKLILSRNNLTFIPADFFHSFKDLFWLSLSFNKLGILDPEWFKNLVNLEILQLSGCDLTELPRGVFAPLTKLRKLSLDQNKLTVIHSDSFGTDIKPPTIYLLPGNSTRAMYIETRGNLRVLIRRGHGGRGGKKVLPRNLFYLQSETTTIMPVETTTELSNERLFQMFKQFDELYNRVWKGYK